MHGRENDPKQVIKQDLLQLKSEIHHKQKVKWAVREGYGVVKNMITDTSPSEQ